jgi:heavy-metal resistance protein
VKRWWLVLALLLSLGVNLGILATIAIGRLRPPAAQRAAQPPPEQRLARLADRLGLAGEERERFLALQRRFFADTSGDRRHLQQIYRQVRRELTAEHPDSEHLEQLLTESSQVYLKIERAVTANVLATRKVLKPEQESVFLGLIENMRPGQGPFTQPGAPGPAWNRGLRDGTQPRPRRLQRFPP